jgi:hypothetical protein
MYVFSFAAFIVWTDSLSTPDSRGFGLDLDFFGFRIRIRIRFRLDSPTLPTLHLPIDWPSSLSSPLDLSTTNLILLGAVLELIRTKSQEQEQQQDSRGNKKIIIRKRIRISPPTTNRSPTSQIFPLLLLQFANSAY